MHLEAIGFPAYRESDLYNIVFILNKTLFNSFPLMLGNWYHLTFNEPDKTFCAELSIADN